MKWYKKRFRGVITVFLTLVFLLLFGLFSVLIEGIRVRNARLNLERSLNMGLSSVFSEYYQPLWQEYHLLGLSEEGLEERIRGYMTLDYGLILEELKAEEIVRGTDYNGQIFLHQAEAYEKYRLLNFEEKEDFAGSFGREADRALELADGEKLMEGEELSIPEGLAEQKEGRHERKKLKSLKDVWGRNILGMVLDNPSSLSKKRIEKGPSVGGGRYSLSSTSPEKNLRQMKQLLREEAVEQTELSYYRRHFKSYRKPSVSFQKKESLLEYELEYLLEGRGGDRENMEAWLRRLVLARTTVNYLLLSKDVEKSQAAYHLALAALGVTGLEPLIRAAQQFILLGWGYEEALVDARVLLDGGSVSLWKGKEEFSISFSEIFTFSKELVREKSRIRRAGKAAGGMDYEDYISLFLGFKKGEKRREAAWHLIGENMELRYGEKFSLKNTVFGAHVRALSQLPGRLGKDWYLAAERHYSY